MEDCKHEKSYILYWRPGKLAIESLPPGFFETHATSIPKGYTRVPDRARRCVDCGILLPAEKNESEIAENCNEIPRLKTWTKKLKANKEKKNEVQEEIFEFPEEESSRTPTRKLKPLRITEKKISSEKELPRSIGNLHHVPPPSPKKSSLDKAIGKVTGDVPDAPPRRNRAPLRHAKKHERGHSRQAKVPKRCPKHPEQPAKGCRECKAT